MLIPFTFEIKCILQGLLLIKLLVLERFDSSVSIRVVRLELSGESSEFLHELCLTVSPVVEDLIEISDLTSGLLDFNLRGADLTLQFSHHILLGRLRCREGAQLLLVQLKL